MSQLDPRKESILRAVVFEYVTDAEPIGSEMLATKYQLGVKSATIRNELADLSDMGLLEQPHTSAGRIPSDMGYRYFVDRLIVIREPAAEEKHQLKEVAAEGEALQELLTETTRLLSRLTHLFSAAATVKNPNLRIRSAVVSALGPKQALCVLALDNGKVETRMLEIPSDLSLTDLGRVNELLSVQVVGQPLAAMAKGKAPKDPANPRSELLLARVWTALRSISREMNKVSITTGGEEFLFQQPEFKSDAGALAQTLDSLKNSNLLSEALASGHDSPQQVTIGKENPQHEMHSLSMIKQAFFVGDHEAGVIAIVGPTRMKYESSIPLVSFTAKALSDALTKFLRNS